MTPSPYDYYLDDLIKLFWMIFSANSHLMHSESENCFTIVYGITVVQWNTFHRMIIQFLNFYASGRLTPDEFIIQGSQVLFHHLVGLLCQLLFNFNRIHFPRKITQFMENLTQHWNSSLFDFARFFRLRMQSFIVVGPIIEFGTKRDLFFSIIWIF